MKKKVYYLFSLIFILSLIFAPITFSETEPQKLLNNAPVKEDYTNADGVYIENITKIDHTGEKSRIRYRKVIKVFNKRGVKNYGEFKIRFNKSNEKVNLIEAKTIKKDGEVLKPKEKAINEITPPEAANASIYSDARIKVISMSGVEPGSILVCEYEKVKDSYAIKDEFWNYQLFQYTDPIKRNKLELKVPKNKEVNYKVRNGNIEPTVQNKQNYKLYTWEQQNVPAIVKEKNMPSLLNIAPLIEISTIDDWSQVSTWYQGLIKDQYEINQEIKNKIKELTKDSNEQEDKIRNIYNYVTSQIRYIGLQFGESGYKPYSAKTTFENKYGVCKEKATLLIAMLREIGVKAEPVLINRGSATVDLDIPSPALFNHMIVYLPEKDMYLDPTSKGTMKGVLPGDQGKNVFLPESNKITKSPISDAVQNQSISIQTVELKEDGSADIVYQEKMTGLYGFTYKRAYQKYKEEQITRLIKRGISRGFTNASVEKINYKGINNLDEELSIEIPELKVKNYAEKMGNMLTIKPFKFPINLTQVVASKTRSYPIYLSFKRNIKRQVNINIPAGYKINYLPKNQTFSNEVGSLKVNYKEQKEKIMVDFNLIVDRKEISADEYKMAKKLLNKAGSSLQNQIMVKNTNN